MENMTVSDLAMVVAAAGDSATPALHNGGVRTFVTVLMVGVALFIFLTICGFPLLGFRSTGPALGSIAAAWMSCIGNVAKGSFYALVHSISMSGPSAMVLLCIVALVAAAWGSLEAIVWLFHAIDWHWLLQVVHSATDWVDLQGWWHSVTTWVVHLWDSMPPLLQVWHSVTDWVSHLWDSIPAHRKWKILYT